MKSIKILVLHLNYGGAEKQISTMANALCSRHNIEIISLYTIGEKPFYELDSRISIRYLLPYGPNRDAFYNAVRKRNVFSILKEGISSAYILFMKKRKMIDAIKKLTGDVIISSRIEFTEWLQQYGDDRLITITQEHSFFENEKYINRMKNAFSSTNALVVMSTTALHKHQAWLNGLPLKIVKISNMIDDFSGFIPPQYEAKTMVSVGRMHQVKRFDLMISMFEEAVEIDPEWRLVLIGDGEELRTYKKLVEEKDLGRKILFTGALPQREILDWYKRSSIFLLSSSSESFSLVLAEAQAAGLASIAFDVEVGPRDIIQNGETGFLVTEGNRNEFINKMHDLMLNMELRIQFGNAAHENAKRFQASIIAQEWVDLIESL